ncbi:permease [Metabacillus lacus]|uniref:permease n=1 Tax=Metabacillus lacus TaxID=1983721 RepID=UPI001FE33FFF|nr:permease [Metabacillus lacus]
MTGEAFGLVLLIMLLILFLFSEEIAADRFIPHIAVDTGIIFLSIILEAIPFVILGVFVSSLIQVYISEERLKNLIPSRPIAAIIPAALLGALLPICECAIIPVVRRLISKGMPVHIGMVLLMTAPVLNPITALSTYYAFRPDLSVLYGRLGITFLCSIIIGLLIFLRYRYTSPLKVQLQPHIHQKVDSSRVLKVCYHTTQEFFDMGRYLIMGALAAGLFQTMVNRDLLNSLGQNTLLAPVLMMALAFLLSLCSEADAFVAATFSQSFTTGSIVAFLVYGPAIDFKNMLMMLAYFRFTFVMFFFTSVTLVIYGTIILLQ